MGVVAPLSPMTEAILLKHLRSGESVAFVADQFGFTEAFIRDLWEGPAPAKLLPGVRKSNVVWLVPPSDTAVTYVSIVPPTYERVLDVVRRSFGLHRSVLMSADRSKKVQHARAALFMLMAGSDLDVSKIAHVDISTVRCCRRRASHLLLNDIEFTTKVRRLRLQLNVR